MTFDRQAGGHEFLDGRCVKCRMSREQFEDSGEPRCTGIPPRGPQYALPDDPEDE